MKRMKSGFTLAEVLITLGIIGVVAAIVMPSVMTNYTYKTVGVKLSKFMAQLEGATRPYVVQNTSFDGIGSVAAFLEESYIIKDGGGETTEVDCDNTDDANFAVCGGQTGTINIDLGLVNTTLPTFGGSEGRGASLQIGDTANTVTIKDGTRFQVYPINNYADNASEINERQVGEVVWGIAFDPVISGLPRDVHRAFRFVVTELGYVFPDRDNDACSGLILDANFETNPRFFENEDNAACLNGFVAAETDGDDDNS